jgi:outer membrane lipoprotein SlyB
MRTTILTVMAAATALSGCATYGGYGNNRYAGYSAYDYNRADPAYGGYYADRYYVENSRYRERRLSSNDRVYRGQDGRYYCRRNDGTTGLIVGAAAGGTLGAAIAPGGSGLLGALIGGAAGAALGKSVDSNNVRCR